MLGCYNHLLGDWIKKEAAPLGDQVTAGTLHSLMRRVSAVEVPHDASQQFWAEELPARAIDALLDGHPLSGSFDVLVVDEAQDVCTPVYLDVLDLLVKGGLSAGRVFALGDFEHQSIYSGQDARDLLGERMQLAECPLSDNCRNRPRIGSLASSAFGRNPYGAFRRADDGVEVVFRRYRDAEEQSANLASLVDQFRSDGYQLGDIAILSPLAHGAVERLGAPHSGWVAPAAASPGPKIRYSTVHAFKGLESPAVIVTDLTSLASNKQRLLLYIAATRATDRLGLCVAEAAVPELQRLIIGGS